jgi:hypothetical protein
MSSKVPESKPIAESDQSSYGAVRSAQRAAQKLDGGLTAIENEVDQRMPSKMRDFCDTWVVAPDQFENMEDPVGAMLCARALRMFLIVFVITATVGLIVGFILKRALPGGGALEMEQVEKLGAPSVMLCASPWGTSFKNFKVNSVEKGIVPGDESYFSAVKFDEKAVNSTATLSKCQHVLLSTVLMPHGEIGQYTSFDTIRLGFTAETEDGTYNFGFTNSDGPLPQVWSYASLGSRVTGHINYDQLNVGKNEVFDGTPRSSLTFQSSGSVNSKSGVTELEYFYQSFMIRTLSVQTHGLTLFTVVTFVLLVAAAVNNCGLFDIFFVEYVPDDEPPPVLEPNVFFRATLGKCFSSCRRRKGIEDETVEAAGGA